MAWCSFGLTGYKAVALLYVEGLYSTAFNADLQLKMYDLTLKFLMKLEAQFLFRKSQIRLEPGAPGVFA